MDIQSLKRNTTTINEGRWIEDIPEMGQLRLRVRAENSPKVAALRAKKLRAVPRDQRERDGTPRFEALMQITSEVLHEAVLLDWDGLTDGGLPVKYDADLAREWLTNPEYQEFADAVAWASRVAANEREVVAGEVVGNSRKR